MYLLNLPPVEYTDPWSVPLEKRLRELEKGHRRVAYVYLLPDGHTFRYRVYNMVQVLQESVNGTSAAYFTEHDLAVMDKVVDIADVIVVCRTKYDRELSRIITRARSKGKTVFFDVDDLVFDVNYIHMILNTLDLDRNHPVTWDNWFAHVGRINATMQLCDRAIATNGYLATYLQPYFSKPVDVLPNFLNREQMKISEQIYKIKKTSNFARTNRIHLGYFSGTPSHNRDLEVAVDALVKTLKSNPHVILRVVGHIDLRSPLRNYLSQIEHYPAQDFINLQRLIGQVEINLVPLQDNEFTNCKSELKYFEAGIVGTVSIATPTFSFAQTIRDGENGFLAKSFEWYDKIQGLLEMNELNLDAEMIENAFNHSVKNYAWYNQLERIENAIFSEAPSLTASNIEIETFSQLQVRSGHEKNITILQSGDIKSEKDKEFQTIKKQLIGLRRENLKYAERIQWVNQEYGNLEIKLNEREQILQSLNLKLLEIYSSRSWRVVQLFWKLRLLLIPRGSMQEKMFGFLKNVILHPRKMIRNTLVEIKQGVDERQKKRMLLRMQNDLMKKNFSRGTKKLIVFLMPGVDAINGGTMSVCSLAEVSQSLKFVHSSDVLIATLPGSNLITKYTKFKNHFDIYRFEQLYSYFKKIDELIIHLPEVFVLHFLSHLSHNERKFLLGIPKLSINIMNQNIWLMPPREIVAQVKQITNNVTCTTAHSSYCTREIREHYGIPFHYFSASNLTNYYYSSYQGKENLMIVSPDTNMQKERILTKLQSEHPEIKIKQIEKMSYEEYKQLLSRAKWAVTFGEGIDGYFVESIRSGAIPFAVYNKDFFNDRFRGLPNVYLSYEEMYRNLSDDLRKIDVSSIFQNLSEQLIALDKQEYDDEEYKRNIRLFYLKEYTLP